MNQQTDIVRVEFLNDGTENGVNRNLVVNMLTASYNTTPTTFGLIPTSVPNTFTTANFSPLAVTGFTSSNATDGQSGNVLHTNGYVEYFLPIVNNNPTPPVESQFKIELVNEGTISAGGFAIIEQAATFLESVVVGDVRGATDLTI